MLAPIAMMVARVAAWGDVFETEGRVGAGRVPVRAEVGPAGVGLRRQKEFEIHLGHGHGGRRERGGRRRGVWVASGE